MLPEIDSLPRSQAEATRDYRQRDTGQGQDAANVCRHIIGPFGSMQEVRPAIGNEVAHETFEVATHIAIRILGHDQRCASVLKKHVAQARRDSRAPHNLLDPVRNVHSAPPGRRNLDRLLH